MLVILGRLSIGVFIKKRVTSEKLLSPVRKWTSGFESRIFGFETCCLCKHRLDLVTHIFLISKRKIK